MFKHLKHDLHIDKGADWIVHVVEFVTISREMVYINDMQIKCPQCEFESSSFAGIASHTSKQHSLSGRELYDALHPGESHLCACGCGSETNYSASAFGYSSFLKGHARRKPLKVNGDAPLCMCGCGKTTLYNRKLDSFNSYVHGHNAKGKENAFKGFTKETHEKFRRQSQALMSNTAERSRRSLVLKERHAARGMPRGPAHPNWKGGTSAFSDFLRGHQRLYTQWRLPILKRDAFRCRICNSVGAKLNVHHDDVTMAHIVGIFCKDSRQMSQDDKVEVARQVIDYHIDNDVSGVTLCEKCHKAVHAKREDDAWQAFDKFAEFITSAAAGVVDRKTWSIIVDDMAFVYCDLVRTTADKQCFIKQTERGYRAFYVFEDEWRDRRPIVESMVKARLGKSSLAFDARKCVVVKPSVAERRAFLEANHLDGDVNASEAFGLSCGGKLVACMSLRRPLGGMRRMGDVLEVARFATLLDSRVRGGLGRLLAAARAAHPGKSFSTYVDLRHGDGKSYEAVGFKDAGQTSPRFWWTDFDRRFDRLSTRADKARGMSEAAVAEERGVVRIYGCPNRRLTLCK